MLLLFSGGTFLYVATAHVLPEIQAGNIHHEELDEGAHEGHSHASSGSRRTPPKMKWSETALLVSGVLLPLLLDVRLRAQPCARHHGRPVDAVLTPLPPPPSSPPSARRFTTGIETEAQ